VEWSGAGAHINLRGHLIERGKNSRRKKARRGGRRDGGGEKSPLPPDCGRLLRPRLVCLEDKEVPPAIRIKVTACVPRGRRRGYVKRLLGNAAWYPTNKGGTRQEEDASPASHSCSTRRVDKIKEDRNILAEPCACVFTIPYFQCLGQSGPSPRDFFSRHPLIRCLPVLVASPTNGEKHLT
jgi:hypothetical protein